MSIERITSASDGSELEFSYFYRDVSITEDGRFVTFLSTSPELTDDFPDGGLNPGYHFIHDTQTDETIRIPIEEAL